MLSAVWRVSGPGIDPVSFCERFGLEPAAVWKRGDRRADGKVVRQGWCNIAIPGEDAAPALLSGLRRFLTRHRRAFLWLKRRGVTTELDVGVGIQSDSTRTVAFAPPLLALLSTYGVILRVSGYPVSDES